MTFQILKLPLYRTKQYMENHRTTLVEQSMFQVHQDIFNIKVQSYPRTAGTFATGH